MRPIDADALIEILAVMQGRCNTKAELIHNSKIWQQVKNMPTIDAVPVIRCKDCKHSLRNQFTGDWYCWLYNIAREVESDGFCYKAERINSGQRYATDLIRCKDCKHRDPEDKKCDCGHGIIWQLSRDDDWFCADAERKEE